MRQKPYVTDVNSEYDVAGQTYLLTRTGQVDKEEKSRKTWVGADIPVKNTVNPLLVSSTSLALYLILCYNNPH